MVDTGPDLAPRCFEVLSTAGTARLEFPRPGRFRYSSPGEDPREGSTAGMRCLLPANSLPILAAIVYQHGPWSGPLDLSFFSPESLQVVPYTLERRGREIVTSFGETIRLDRAGWIIQLTLPGQHIRVTRRQLAWPRWRSRASEAAAPARPSRTRVRSVELEIGSGALKVGGTLALPASKPARAAAVFIGGSGWYDRDGSGPVRLGYGDLGDRLAVHGIATLRYEKSLPGPAPRFEGLVTRARAALVAMRRRADMRGLPMFLIGHSEGGLIALEVAQGRNDLAGVILLATAGRSLDLVLLEQARTQAEQLGLGPDWISRAQDEIRELFHHARHSPRWTAGRVPTRLLLVRRLRPWYHALAERDPVTLVGGLHCPLLVLQGKDDLQVSVTDARLLHRAARARGIRTRLVLLADHDHLLRYVPRKGGFASYGDQRRRISNVVSDTLVRWILGLARAPGHTR